MNQIEMNLKNCIQNAIKKAFDVELSAEEITVEIPKETSHGDYSTNTGRIGSTELTNFEPCFTNSQSIV